MDLNMFTLQYLTVPAAAGNLNTGPSFIPMGMQTQVLNQTLGGDVIFVEMNLIGSLDMANALITMQFITNNTQSTVVDFSVSELDFFGLYNPNGTQIGYVQKFSDIDKSYTLSVGGATPLVPVDQIIINITYVLRLKNG